MNSNRRIDASRKLLGEQSYDFTAADFVRLPAEPVDDVVAGIVRAVTAEGSSGCTEFRQRQSEEEEATLLLFAMRRTTQGLRASSLGPLYEALDGFALVASPHDIPWNSWFKTALFLMRSLGADPGVITRRFAEVANDDLAQRYDIAMEAMDRVVSLDQCLMVQVSTTHGAGLVEILVFHDTTTKGPYSAPSLGSNRIEYRPTTNLAQLTTSLADAIDASGTLRTGPIGQDQLAATLFSLTTKGSYVASLGCLSFTGENASNGSSFTTFVAELPDDADPTELAAAACAGDEQAAIYSGQRLIVVSPQPRFDDLDIDVDLDQIEVLASNALADPANG